MAKRNTGRLRNLDQERAMSKADYKPLLKAWQLDLLTLQQSMRRGGGRVVVNVEGMDAAGKGGAIRRLVQRIDPRGYKVYPIGAPATWEQSRHYLYRFWTRLPGPGELVIFDRSWFGRVLVERVEELVPAKRWREAYAEINAFEQTLADDGVVLVKLWFHVDPDEQLRRFQARREDPFKSWKLTDEDWRNRERWDDYVAAAEDMFEKTDTGHAPWTVIASNNKHYARLVALRAVVNAMREALIRAGGLSPKLVRPHFD